MFVAVLPYLQDGAIKVFLAGPELATPSFLHDLQLRLDSGPLVEPVPRKEREPRTLSLLH